MALIQHALDAMKKPQRNLHCGLKSNFQSASADLEQLFQSPRAVTNALDRYAGFVCDHNKRAIISIRGARKLFLLLHQQREKPQRNLHCGLKPNFYSHSADLEQLFQSPRAVTNALNRHAGFVCDHNKRAIISIRGARKLSLLLHQQREKP